MVFKTIALSRSAKSSLVGIVGFEPTRCYHQGSLSPRRLPFRHIPILELIERFELTTYCLQGNCSTIKLYQHASSCVSQEVDCFLFFVGAIYRVRRMMFFMLICEQTYFYIMWLSLLTFHTIGRRELSRTIICAVKVRCRSL